jgi:hypothetical protein
MWYDQNGEITLYSWIDSPQYLDFKWVSYTATEGVIVFLFNGLVHLAENIPPDHNPPRPGFEQLTPAFIGDGNSLKFVRLHIQVELPATLPNWKHQFAAPFLTISGMDKGDENHYGGCHLLNVEMENQGLPIEAPAVRYAFKGTFGIHGDRFRITRLSFSFTATGIC